MVIAEARDGRRLHKAQIAEYFLPTSCHTLEKVNEWLIARREFDAKNDAPFRHFIYFI